MGASLVVVVIIAAAESGTEASNTMIAAARDALGESAVILVQPRPKTLSDEDAAAVGEQINAGAVVEVTWPGNAHESVHLHVRYVASKRWVDRDLAFAATEPIEERGRAAGLTIASMVAAPPTAVDDAPKKPAVPSPRPDTRPRHTTARVETAPPTLAIEALGIGGVGGAASGVGGELGARLTVPDRAFLRVAGGVRYGSIDAAAASSALLRLAFGVGVEALQRGPITLSVEVDALAFRHSVSRIDAVVETKSRWISGADVLADFEWRVARQVALVGDAGMELSVGETRIWVGDQVVTTIRRWRAIFGIGVRFRL